MRARPSGPESIFDAVDAGAAVRAASMGFTILLVGGLAAPALARIPAVGPFALTAVAVIAFAVAGLRIGATKAPLLQGVCAAVGAYLLVLPVVLMTTRHLDPLWTPATVALAVIIGGGAAVLAARMRSHREA
jgi:hypothetical protein